MRQICHISDVHFGPPHLAELSEAVIAWVDERHPDLVVLSGDLTQRAKKAQFRQARAFVDRLAVPTLVVPGNHDVPLYRVWERFVTPFGAYRKTFSRELEPVFRDTEMVVIGINTAHGMTFKNGRFTTRRLLQVGRLLEQVPPGVLKVIVAHHHVIQPPWFDRQPVATSAWEAMDLFTRLGVDLILSGHLHQSFIGNSEEFYPQGRSPVVILHSGTTTSNRGRAGEQDKNTCNWIEVDGETLTVSHHRWEPTLRRFAEHSRHWYPRNSSEPYCLQDR